MKIFNLHFQGGFGNRLFQFCFARAFCSMMGFELRTERWIGERLFENVYCPLADDIQPNTAYGRWSEDQLLDRHKRADPEAPVPHVIHFRSYCQTQKCVDFYTRTQAKKWFTFRPEIRAQLEELGPTRRPSWRTCGAATTKKAGYVLVSVKSYADAAMKFRHPGHRDSFQQSGQPPQVAALHESALWHRRHHACPIYGAW